jgi:hypothetical protein
MSLEKPIIEQLSESTENANSAISNTAASANDSLQNMKNSVQNTLADFSNKGVVGNASEFLESNGLLAKIAFILFVLILFLFFLRLGIQALGYFMSPSKNPFLVYGKLEGATAVTISQDPSDTSSIPIYRSNNEFTGAEFTWSVWLYLNLSADTAPTSPATYVPNKKTIFVKGSSSPNSTTGIHTTNGPGMYVHCDPSGVGHLSMVLDDINNEKNMITVDNTPLQKWVHVAYRLKNTVLDVYINGSINNRVKLKAAPKQNYYDIQLCDNNGFPGYLSNLRYYDHALNVFDINNIVMFGPNLTDSALSSDYQSAGGNYSYLSTRWYNMR